MSRALNIKNDLQHVESTCSRLHLPVSTIETLPSGHTRVVLRTGDAAAILARHYKKDVLSADLARTPLTVKGVSRSLPI